MGYVQGFVIPVPIAGKAAYHAMAAATAPVFLEYGATRVVENWGEDIPDGTLTDFRRAVQAEPGEAIVFSWITWPDRATCDAAHDKVWADPRMKATERGEIPFNPERMIYGGFATIFESGS